MSVTWGSGGDEVVKFGLGAAALLIVAVFVLREISKQSAKKPTPNPSTGSAQQPDPYAGVEDASAFLASPNNDPITEAAYHVAPVSQMVPAFGSETNTDGEEFLSLQ
jgi:hypothetical protein